MADDKRGRDKKAHDAERRQREREIEAELERGDETEPPIDPAALDEVERALESLQFPATGSEVVAAVGDREVGSIAKKYAVEQLVPDAEEETFDSPAAVRARVQRPTVAAAMKRIVETSERFQNADLRGTQRDAYEKTLLKLEAIDADDDDEGIRVISDWIVGRIREDETLPGSRAVRRRAATFCRENGYQVRNDEWLGV